MINTYVKSNIKKSVVYDTYWNFAYERQNIFMKRYKGETAPWTNDKILNEYKFTNAYRASDRVSQYLIKNVIYNTNYNDEDMLFRILIFKIFNKIETWRSLESYVNEISYKSFSLDMYNGIFANMYKNKEKIYSGAYIMASGKSEFGHEKKYENHLQLIDFIMKDNLMLKISLCKSLKELYEILLEYPTIGPFLAYQYAIDINYSELCDFDEMEFVVPGPGAKSGIKKCFENIGEYTESDIIRYMAENQEREFESRNLKFQYLLGRRLQLIDCQNLFCETDKYARVAHPEIKDKVGRTKIKQKFRENKEKFKLYYPPKWNIEIR